MERFHMEMWISSVCRKMGLPGHAAAPCGWGTCLTPSRLPSFMRPAPWFSAYGPRAAWG